MKFYRIQKGDFSPSKKYDDGLDVKDGRYYAAPSITQAKAWGLFISSYKGWEEMNLYEVEVNSYIAKDLDGNPVENGEIIPKMGYMDIPMGEVYFYKKDIISVEKIGTVNIKKLKIGGEK